MKKTCTTTLIKQAAQAEGFITVPAARDRQRQAQQTTTLAEKWRVAHALAAETGDRTDDLLSHLFLLGCLPVTGAHGTRR